MINLITFFLDFKNNVKKYWKWIVGIYIVLVTVLLLIFIGSYKRAKSENNRLANNQTALMTDIEYYKTESGRNASKVMELELTKSEFEKLLPELQKQVKDLKIKNKYLESLSSTGTKTDIDGSATLRDTVYITVKDSSVVRQEAKYFKWADAWNTIEGTVYPNNRVDVSYHGTDTLTMAAVRVPKKFLFFRCGTKYIEVKAVNSNPSTKIIYNQKIKIRKKKDK